MRNKSQRLTKIPMCNLDPPDYHNLLVRTGVPPKKAIEMCIKDIDDSLKSAGIILPKYGKVQIKRNKR